MAGAQACYGSPRRRSGDLPERHDRRRELVPAMSGGACRAAERGDEQLEPLDAPGAARYSSSMRRINVRVCAL